MPDFLNKKLDHAQLERLAFEPQDDYWSDIDGDVMLIEIAPGAYRQFVFDENDEKITFGVTLQTVADLMQRIKSITGNDRRYYTGDLPINAQ